MTLKKTGMSGDPVIDIFVNYRTADARYGAAATYELLADRFERERIFLDNQSMRPGAKYPAELRAALESMRVLLVLIGPRWDEPASEERPAVADREGRGLGAARDPPRAATCCADRSDPARRGFLA